MEPTPQTSNGKTDFIKKQIGSVITKVEHSQDIEDHPALADGVITSIRVGEMALDVVIDFKQEFSESIDGLRETVDAFVEDKRFLTKLWKLVAIIFSTGGALGSLVLVIELWKSVNGT